MGALFGGVIFYFAPLCTKDLGLTDVEMGLIHSVGVLFSFLFFLLAGPLTNKFGRHKTSLIWDLVSSVSRSRRYFYPRHGGDFAAYKLAPEIEIGPVNEFPLHFGA